MPGEHTTLMCISDTDHRRAKPHEDIDDAVTYINEIQAKKGWVFIKEKKDICYYSFEFNRLVCFFSK